MSTFRLPARLAAFGALTALLGACSSMGGLGGAPMAATPAMPFSQALLPSAVQVPAGHRVAMETVAPGEITYECREKAGSPGMHEWFFVGPKADMMDRMGRPAGRYFGPPATWVAADGSTVSGAQVAVAPGAAGAIPLQLVKANPATGQGVMNGVTFIQRVATQGGVAPAAPCTATAVGQRQVVRYQADYIFYKAL